jgi:hypothetical protein
MGMACYEITPLGIVRRFTNTIMQKLVKQPKNPRKTGRPRLFDEAMEDRIIALYERGVSVVILAERFGCTPPTIANVLKKREILPSSNTGFKIRRARKTTKGRRTYADWLKNHPDVTQLPRNIKELAYLAGCTYDSVRCHLWFQRNEVKKILQKLPELQKYPIPILDAESKIFYTSAFATYSFVIDRFSFEVWLNATLVNKQVLTIPIANPAEFVSNVMKWLRENTSDKIKPAKVSQTRWVRVDNNFETQTIRDPEVSPPLEFRKEMPSL